MVDGTAPFEPAREVPNGLDGYVKVAINAQGRRVVDRARRLYEDVPQGLSTPSPFVLPLSRTSPEATGLQPPCACGYPSFRWDEDVQTNSHGQRTHRRDLPCKTGT